MSLSCYSVFYLACRRLWSKEASNVWRRCQTLKETCAWAAEGSEGSEAPKAGKICYLPHFFPRERTVKDRKTQLLAILMLSDAVCLVAWEHCFSRKATGFSQDVEYWVMHIFAGRSGKMGDFLPYSLLNAYYMIYHCSMSTNSTSTFYGVDLCLLLFKGLIVNTL